MTEDRLRHAVVLGGPQATGAATHERDRFLASQAGRPAWPPVLGDGLALLSLLGATLLFYRSFFSPNILASYGSGTGHVFNLGHGIGQFTPIPHVEELLAALRTPA